MVTPKFCCSHVHLRKDQRDGTPRWMARRMLVDGTLAKSTKAGYVSTIQSLEDWLHRKMRVYPKVKC